MKNNLAPDFLNSILPRTVGQNTPTVDSPVLIRPFCHQLLVLDLSVTGRHHC